MIGPVTAEEAKSDTVPNARLSVSIKLSLRQFVIIFNIYNKTEDFKIFLLPYTSAVRLNAARIRYTNFQVRSVLIKTSPELTNASNTDSKLQYIKRYTAATVTLLIF